MVTHAVSRRVVRTTVDEEVARLRTFIGRMEHRYEFSSKDMEEGIAGGRIRETAEISRWLTALHFLHGLTTPGGTTGSPRSMPSSGTP